MGIYDLALAARRRATRCRARAAAPSTGTAACGGGGNLRAAVFGVNDGLVSNASLILGVAGASPDAARRAARPGSPACAPAPSRWRPANTSRYARSASSSSTRSASSATSSPSIRRPRRRSWRSSTPRRDCGPNEASKLAVAHRRRSRARARYAGARGAGPQPRRAGLALGRGDRVVPVVRGRRASCRWRLSSAMSGARALAGGDRRHRAGALRRRRAALAVHRDAVRCIPASRMLVLGGLAGAVTYAVGRLAGVALG